MKKLETGAFITGTINGLLGAGGGIVAVAMLKKNGLSTEKAHATSVCLILILSVVSAAFYIFKGNMPVLEVLKYIPTGILGALLGGYLLPRMPEKTVRFLYALFSIWAGVRMVL